MRAWDLPTRVFHWAVVALVTVSWVSVDNGFMRLHLASGLGLMTLLLSRLAWGIVGSTTARFAEFVTGPRRVIGYLKSLATGDSPHFVGHNPAGGWMVVLMIALLLAQVATGLFANDGVHFNGPLASQVSADRSDWVTGLHATLFNVLLLVVWIHLVAIFFYLWVKGDNLIRPMISGEKQGTEVPAAIKPSFLPLRAALPWVVLSAAVVWWVASH